VTPLLSIIIPTLNEEKLISKTLSQFTQELKGKFNAETIVSDGGSTDRTLEIIHGKADKIITAKPGEKQNIAIGKNRGAENSSGKYLYFFGADTRIKDKDYFFGRTIEELDKSAAALTCNVKVFPEEEELSDKVFHRFYNTHVFMLNKLGIGMGRGECHMIKKDVFIKSGGYNETMAAGEDYDLYRRIKELGKIKFLGDLTVYESPRRYRKFGYTSVFLDWTKNSLSVLFRNKAVSKKWEQVR
jgi:glycosyltransferase involved in cell wall biosynthesis